MSSDLIEKDGENAETVKARVENSLQHFANEQDAYNEELQRQFHFVLPSNPLEDRFHE